MSYKKILITGGHVTPALAVIDRLQKLHSDVQIIFVGRKTANDRETKESFEYQEIKQRKIKFINLRAGRLTRVASIRSLLQLTNVPKGFIQSLKILKAEKPDVVLSFGGYLAFPIALMAGLLNLPVYTHEQTIHPGIANKMIANVARKIFISFPESGIFFPKSKTVVTGNPVRASIFSKKTFIKDNKLPVIYITGGSLGAHAINTKIEQIIGSLLRSYIIIHQTGDVKEFEDYARLSKLKESLSPEQQKNYHLYTHILGDEIGPIYNSADLVISRSGANTFFELLALQKPAIFIPLPWAAHDEQRKHARLYANWGVGEVFEQNQTSVRLLELITSMMKDLRIYQKKFTHVPNYFKTDATDRIIAEIYS
ncbi:MAG: glycosyltransferase [Weeksellaceae bacterium]